MQQALPYKPHHKIRLVTAVSLLAVVGGDAKTAIELFENFPSVNPEDVYAVLDYVAKRLPEEQLELEKEISGFVFPYEL